MWLNNKTGQVYVGSGMKGSTRLGKYFAASILGGPLRIYSSLLKHGHDSFSLIILEVVGDSENVTKTQCLDREQFYLDWAFKRYGLLVLNYLREAGSSFGFKHTEETKKLLSLLKKGLKYSEETKEKRKDMFKGELNPFSGKSHKPETIAKMKDCKKGEKNPMYQKIKSPEFIAHMTKDRHGPNNPQYGKKKSEETLNKLRKLVYVYDVLVGHELVGVYGTVDCAKALKMSTETVAKRLADGLIHRGKYFFSREAYIKSSEICN